MTLITNHLPSALTVNPQEKKELFIPVGTMSIKVQPCMAEFVKNELLTVVGVSEDKFWTDFESLLNSTIPKNRELLAKRQSLKQQVNQFTRDHKTEIGKESFTHKFVEYLKEIGYIIEETNDFKVTTSNVDHEIGEVCGPQLVVPVNNARYALNAANARWGSLFDALYFTDAIPFDGIKPSTAALNEKRAAATISWMDDFLDSAIPLCGGVKHATVTGYSVNGSGKLVISSEKGEISLIDNDAFVGYSHGNNSVLFKHNDLHLELITDTSKSSMVGKVHHAALKDINLESAISVILDCEDSVAAVDAEDKVLVYHNWLGMNTGDLSIKFKKDGKEIIRFLNEDKYWTKAGMASGSQVCVSGRALCFVRNVGIHMHTDAVTYKGESIPEGILDAYITVAAAMADINKGEDSQLRNSKKGSVYIVKPKMHGPEEVSFVCNMFSLVEDLFHLPRNTIKVGIMDEERRTTVNLKECIRVAKERVVFINTGFLDRVGDEIHTIMESGPVQPKADIKKQSWLKSYENWNVDVGLETGLPGHGLIGKGMWAAPDSMGDMLKQKIGHVEQGASCAWVPSPTAATLHATHYHRLYVKEIQKQLQTRKRAVIGVLVTPEPWDFSNTSKCTIKNELKDNIQGLLGYVVRWINHGTGCSKVPNIHNVGLMEDRATLRISSQLVANWLHHGVVSKQQIEECLTEMSKIVDEQNSHDKTYIGYNNQKLPLEATIAFKAAQELIYNGVNELNGYTEPVLHSRRAEFKASQGVM